MMDSLLDWIAIGLSVLAVALALYDHFALKATRREDALVFLRDFNNEGHPPGWRQNNERSNRYFEAVDQLRSYRSALSRDLLPEIDEYLSLATAKRDHDTKERSERLKVIEGNLKQKARERLEKR